MKRTIAVGSTNPVKISAVTKAVEQYFTQIEVMPTGIKSGVSDMPFSKEETRLGAKNRAYRARQERNAWLGLGLEGGVCWIEGELYLFSAVYATDGKTGVYGGETLMRLPKQIANKLVDSNRELGDILDEITGRDNIKQKEGAVGYLSENRLTRMEVFYSGVMMALSNWSS